MDLLVLPNIQNTYKRERARDELPQSAAGRTIMTTEPKFVQKLHAKKLYNSDLGNESTFENENDIKMQKMSTFVKLNRTKISGLSTFKNYV